MEEVIAHAEAQGLRVAWRDLGPRNGELARNGLVTLNPRRTEAVQRITLAHEVGHWWHGHDWTREHSVERDERQADTYAARLLIDEVAIRRAANAVGEHPAALARELGVTARLVTLWLEARQLLV